MVTTKCSEFQSWFIQDKLQLTLSLDSKGKNWNCFWALETQSRMVKVGDGVGTCRPMAEQQCDDEEEP